MICSRTFLQLMINTDDFKAVLKISFEIKGKQAANNLQWMFRSGTQPSAWFLFYPTVFLSARIGGLLYGLASTFIPVMFVWWFFIPPQFTFGSKTPLSTAACP